MNRIWMCISVFFLLTASVPSAVPAVPSRESMEAASLYSLSAGGQATVIIYDGKMVFEGYGNGGSPERLQMLMSGTKSFVGVAAAAAASDGIILFDGKVAEAIESWKDDPLKSEITYRQLLNLTSGLTPAEPGTIGASMRLSWEEIVSKPMRGKPGERFEYGGYSHNAFAYALQQKLDGESFEEYLKRRILDPLGITVKWAFRCGDGNPQVAGGASMTARDWARFGEFIRGAGKFEDKQLIEAEIVAECFRGTDQNPAYGLTWWLARPVSDRIVRQIRTLRNEWAPVANSGWLPADLVAACGAGKQRLYVIPSLKLTVVRQGRLSLSGSFEDVMFLRLLLGQDDS